MLATNCLRIRSLSWRYLYKFSKQQRENKIDDYDEHVKRVYERYTPADIINFAIAKNVARRIL